MSSSTYSRVRGFTIVELLIVIVVIAILATISVVAYTGIQTRALNTARVNEARQWQKLLTMYAAQHGGYPDALTSGSRACLGAGFPDVNTDSVGDCWDLHVPGHTSVLESLNAQLASMGSLPSDSRTPVAGNGTTSRIGPAVVNNGGGAYHIIFWISGLGACPDGTDNPWTDSRSRQCRIILPAQP